MQLHKHKQPRIAPPQLTKSRQPFLTFPTGCSEKPKQSSALTPKIRNSNFMLRLQLPLGSISTSLWTTPLSASTSSQLTCALVVPPPTGPPALPSSSTSRLSSPLRPRQLQDSSKLLLTQLPTPPLQLLELATGKDGLDPSFSHGLPPLN